MASSQEANTRFPALKVKHKLPLNTILPSQIYTVDNFLSAQECKEVIDWARLVDMEAPKKPGKGEAERTAYRGSLDSPSIASHLLNLISPYLSQLDPPPSSRVEPMLSPNIRIYHYPPQSFFRGHYDSPQLDPRTRRLSCWTVLVYLTAGVKGGSTTFHLPKAAMGKKGSGDRVQGGKGKKVKSIGKEVKSSAEEKDKGVSQHSISIEPKQGRLLLHWHGVAKGGCMLHEGEEVLQGDKWVLRTDVLA